MQKLQIVRESRDRGHRVGVTGDGVNDAPALKAADVGIAMASGSEVARGAANIVLLKDDFAAIPHGVSEGRVIHTNLRKVRRRDAVWFVYHSPAASLVSVILRLRHS